MPGDEQVLSVVNGWVQKAESDLKAVVLILRGGEEAPADTAAFHAQQCAEKYLKALLTHQGIDFPKTHDIGQLILLLPHSAAISLPAEEQRRLTSYATVTRYPGDFEPVTIHEARRAVAVARRIRKQVRKLLPAPALRGGSS
jgi:HEPN domain-containing protein